MNDVSENGRFHNDRLGESVRSEIPDRSRKFLTTANAKIEFRGVLRAGETERKM